MKECRGNILCSLLIIQAGLYGCSGSGKDIPPPSGLTVSDTSAGEGDSGVATLIFPVTLQRVEGNNSTVRVNYATTGDGTATAGSDYRSTSGSITFNPGETRKSITVEVLGDTVDEGNETLGVSLSGGSNAPIVGGSATGAILDDEAAPVLSVADAAVTEGDSGSTPLNFSVRLSRAASQPVTAGFATADGSATAGTDYTAQSSTLTFAPGEVQKTVAVTVLGDTELEPNETLSLTLSTPTNAALGRATATGTINNNEPLPDTAPNDFTFTDQSGVPVSTVRTSNDVTISGLNQPAPISVSGGSYSIGCNANFSTGPGAINNGDSVCVRHTSSPNTGTKVDTTLDIGGVTDTFSSTTATPTPDARPDDFTFTDRENVARGSDQVSNTVTIAGINQPAGISVSGGEYSIGCGASFTSNSGTINNGDTVCVRHTASPNYSTQVNTTLNVGGVSDAFSTTTESEPAPEPDTTPDSFSFNDVNEVPPGTEQRSNSVQISGINQAAAISVSNGEYSIGCSDAGFTSSNGTISNGQSVCVRHTSSADPGVMVTTTLTVGGVSDDFRSTTAAAPPPPS